jgi:hypothetical protein
MGDCNMLGLGRVRWWGQLDFIDLLVSKGREKGEGEILRGSGLILQTTRDFWRI